MVTTAGQAPAPLQVAAAVAVLPVQLALRHAVVAGATWQTPPAAHRPVFPQGGVLPQRVSLRPAVTAAQVPFGCPVRALLQAVQVPVQALPQQNPSTHAPDRHCDAAVQAPPVDVRHCPAEQTLPAPQTMPQPPQLLALVWVSTQVPLQAT